MPTPFEIADRYVGDLVTANPVLATRLGVPGHDHRWRDLSPAGRADLRAIHAAARDAMSPLRHHVDPDQALAAEVVHGYAQTEIDAFDEGDAFRDLAHMVCSFEEFRDVFDLMVPTSEEGLEPIVARLESIGTPYAGYRAALAYGISRGWVVAVRQVRSVIDQATALAGPGSAYDQLIGRAAASSLPANSVERLGAAAQVAKAEAAGFAAWLEREYLPHATTVDGVGRERFVRKATGFLGMEIDPDQIYDWGWEEIDSLLAEMRRVAQEIDPDASIAEVARLLEEDPGRSAGSVEEFLAFVQRRLEQALVRLDGSHFDVPEPIRSVAVKEAPAGSPPGASYIDPSEDFSRPGTVYYSLAHRETFPLYQEVSTAYHEGFPGHHLEIGLAKVNADRLSRAQRSVIWYSGFGEGWALYAERIMDELGFLELPEYRFGYLANQLFRACRVVIDIGLHLGFRLPAGAPIDPGAAWSPELGARFLRQVGLQAPADAASEIDRYLGWPAQAISYKVGERAILDVREETRSRLGPAFDMKGFHDLVLSGGNLPLDLLRRRMSAAGR